MDYGEILARGWRITWENKYLWLLGFLAALGSVNGGGNGYRTSAQRSDADLERLFADSALLLGIGCLALFIGLAVWLVGLIARGGLISAAARLDDGEKMTLGEAFGAGTAVLGRLVGVSLLLYGPFVLFTLLGIGALFALGGAAFVAGLAGESSEALAAGGGLFILCLVSFVCLLIPVAILVGFIYPFAMRGAVLQGLGPVAAISHGWQVLRGNVGEILLLALLFFVISLIYGFAIVIVLFPLTFLLFAPALASGFNGASLGTVEVALLAVGTLCLGIVAALLSSILTTWQSTSFTLAYKQWVAKKPQAAF
ncbi:MAG: hypothetical protein L0332_19845 [Chloroflexi bacterium]|nr:hypothetical protein [Chloroflexota bacterium]MCI0578652.1 hypothetical protein [Chloroflexota bacterium]MCI0647225.1 hypothetical protein [Chloroflexota bacterium]MCI0728951.1 hypothetical protein [Chloroflexota bacterium]